MKLAFATVCFLLSAAAFAHPGHGAPGFMHEHWSVFIGAALLLLGSVIAVRACRAALRKIRREPTARGS